MAIQEQIQHRPRRHREEESVSTFPEKMVYSGGGPDERDAIDEKIDLELERYTRLMRELGERSIDD